MLTSVTPTFLYPTSRQYPFDQVCSQIVHALEKRNWNVPKIDIEMGTYGRGEEKYTYVNRIKGEFFKLWFCREQGNSLPYSRWNDVAAVSEITIPYKEIQVYYDESGPTYNVYVGHNWEEDMDWWLTSSKVNTKLNRQPRRHLNYKGKNRLPDAEGSYDWYRPGSRNQFLVHNNDLGREYDLGHRDPPYYLTEQVMLEFAEWLREHVLNYIDAFPEQPPRQPEQKIFSPFPRFEGQIFTYVETNDAHRILAGQSDPESLEPADRYALIGSGSRLVPLTTPNDGTVPELAYDGFLWCAVGEVNPNQRIEELPTDIGSEYRWERHNHVVRITPKFAEEVYVIDISPQEKYKDKIWRENPNQNRLTDSQFAEYLRIGGRTIVPITEYDGSYEEPIVLIRRELDFDEVEIVIGPVLTSM